MLEVLTRLHARSCQICDEVLTLLGAGLADGAMARWRTLHEVSVVALFIQQHGEELATRYVEHEIVEAFRAAREYHERQDQLGYEPITDEELGRLKLNYEAVLRKYGDPFATQYGWAAHHLDNRRPSIASIEYAIGTGHLRPHYRLASHNVHPNPKGVFFKLGLLQETAVLLAGPSNAGLDEPGPSTALSLLKATMPLAMMNPTLDTVVVLNILTALEREIGAAFVEAARRLQEKAHLHANEP